MACVMYDFSCFDCKHTDYSRSKIFTCKKCKSENVHNVLEWDEADDHHEEIEHHTEDEE